MTQDRFDDETAESKRRWFRIIILLIAYGVLLAVGHWGSGWLLTVLQENFGPFIETHARHVAMAGIALYTMFMALPFVPGMEISLALFATIGPPIAIYIYASTVVALTVTFLVGRLVPANLVGSFFGYLGFDRAEALVRQLDPLSSTERLELLIANTPKRFVPTFLKYRYLAIAAALNLPGNAIIGGGGGIALVAGMSGLFSLTGFILMVALAVLPVPLAVLLIGP